MREAEEVTYLQRGGIGAERAFEADRLSDSGVELDGQNLDPNLHTKIHAVSLLLATHVMGGNEPGCSQRP